MRYLPTIFNLAIIFVLMLWGDHTGEVYEGSDKGLDYAVQFIAKDTVVLRVAKLNEYHEYTYPIERRNGVIHCSGSRYTLKIEGDTLVWKVFRNKNVKLIKNEEL